MILLGFIVMVFSAMALGQSLKKKRLKEPMTEEEAERYNVYLKDFLRKNNIY